VEDDDDGVGLEATGKLMGVEKIMTSKRTCVMEEKLGPERVRRHVYLVIPIGLPLHELNLLNAQNCNVYLFVCYPHSHGWWFVKIMSAVSAGHSLDLLLWVLCKQQQCKRMMMMIRVHSTPSDLPIDRVSPLDGS
jgi:hypothetical protein